MGFNGTTQYLTGTIANINDNSFSTSFWVYMRAKTTWFFSIGNQAVNYKYLHAGFSGSYNYLFNFRGDDGASVNNYRSDLNTKEKMIYCNGVKN